MIKKLFCHFSRELLNLWFFEKGLLSQRVEYDATRKNFSRNSIKSKVYAVINFSFNPEKGVYNACKIRGEILSSKASIPRESSSMISENLQSRQENFERNIFKEK